MDLPEYQPTKELSLVGLRVRIEDEWTSGENRLSHTVHDEEGSCALKRGKITYFHSSKAEGVFNCPP